MNGSVRQGQNLTSLMIEYRDTSSPVFRAPAARPRTGSVIPEITRRARDKKVLVIIDSDHQKDHVPKNEKLWAVG